jgi:hypothetical protein
MTRRWRFGAVPRPIVISRVLLFSVAMLLLYGLKRPQSQVPRIFVAFPKLVLAPQVGRAPVLEDVSFEVVLPVGWGLTRVTTGQLGVATRVLRRFLLSGQRPAKDVRSSCLSGAARLCSDATHRVFGRHQRCPRG